jgi:hypothetical protein
VDEDPGRHFGHRQRGQGLGRRRRTRCSDDGGQGQDRGGCQDREPARRSGQAKKSQGRGGLILQSRQDDLSFFSCSVLRPCRECFYPRRPRRWGGRAVERDVGLFYPASMSILSCASLRAGAARIPAGAGLPPPGTIAERLLGARGSGGHRDGGPRAGTPWPTHQTWSYSESKES